MKSISYLAVWLCDYKELMLMPLNRLDWTRKVMSSISFKEKELKGEPKYLCNYSTNLIYLCDFKYF